MAYACNAVIMIMDHVALQMVRLLWVGKAHTHTHHLHYLFLFFILRFSAIFLAFVPFCLPFFFISASFIQLNAFHSGNFHYLFIFRWWVVSIYIYEMIMSCILPDSSNLRPTQSQSINCCEHIQWDSILLL